MGIVQKIRAPIDKAIDWLIGFLVKMAKAAGRFLVGAVTGRGQTPASGDVRTAAQKEADLRAGIREGSDLLKQKGASERKVRTTLAGIKTKYRLTALDLVVDNKDKVRERVHIRGAVNPTYDGDGYVINAWPPDRVVIEAVIGAPAAKRKNFEKVLETPGRAGLPGYQRAHLLGAGYGVESPLGILYAPTEVNQRIQEKSLDTFIRAMYTQKYPGAVFTLRAEAVAHPVTARQPVANLLSRFVYTLYGQGPGEPERTEIFQFRIIVNADVTNPQFEVQSGGVDPDALALYTASTKSIRL
jgi:hypothetical protein